MVYIIGLGRSGSTLLTAVLNNHSQIKAIPEIPLILFFAHEYKGIHGKTESLEKKTITYLNLIQNIRPKSIIDLKVEQLHNVDYSNYIEYCESIFAQFKIINSLGSKKIYVDKNPQYTFYTNELKNIDPNAKFIILVRDYRDNVLSRMEKPHNKTDHPVYNAFRNRFYLKELAKKKDLKNSILIHYEDLAKSPITEIKKICTFLSVPFENEMFEFNQSEFTNLEVKKSDMNEFINKHFSNLGKPITNSSVGKWKEKLAQKDLELIESICDKYGKLFHYNSTLKLNPYYWLVIRYLPHYTLAKWHILKDKIIYFIPSSIKIKRSKMMYKKFLN
jgi:hypothetical protein